MALITGEKFSVVYQYVEYEFEVADEGGFVVRVPSYPSAISQGDTFEQALGNIVDALTEALVAAKETGT